MLLYDKIDISEELDRSRSNRGKESMICHYCFFNQGFKCQDFLCNGCHDLANLCLNISDIAIITVKNVDYYCINHAINKSEGIDLFPWKSWDYIKNIIRYLAWRSMFKKENHLKKDFEEELMPIAWYTKNVGMFVC